MERGKYFDDLEVGERFVTLGRTVTETDLVTWVGLTGTREELFMNREFARRTMFGRTIVPAPLTQALASGLFSLIGVMHGTTVAFLSGQIRAIAPLFLGDTIRDEVEVSGKKRTSKPDRGVVTMLHTVTNQHGQAVVSFNTTFMMWRRRDLVEAEE